VTESRRLCLALLTCAALLAHPALAQANDENLGTEGGWGALAAVSTLGYGPLKVCYATLGMMVGGMAWGVTGGDSEVMNTIITSSVRGDYVVTPDHLRGRQTLEFLGRDPAYRRSEVVADSW
jgi:hypothetical protein